jgi:NAD(P)-dependent dehydrogenase (short-subunit alcohol dehydrogenase family)
LVTGGARGIGEAIAVAFHAQGDQVTVTGLNDEEVHSFAQRNPQVAARKLDVTQPAMITALMDGLGDVHVLVNCAGILLREQREHDPNQFAKVVDVNLNGTMRMATACKDRLVAGKGCMINIASMLTFFGSPYVPAYSASKGGVAQLTKSLAIAWAPLGVRVNAIAPGWIMTSMTEPLYSDPERRESILRRTPMGRWGTPDDIAGAALFLCSPAAAFITGVVLPVDGGYCISG